MTNLAYTAEVEGRADWTRQKGWFDPTTHKSSVTLVGVGGIGSVTALALAKLGIQELTLIDPDTVELHNLPNQMFPVRLDDGPIGLPKAYVAQDFLATMSNVTITNAIETDIQSFVEHGKKFSDVIVSGLDSMEARTELWKHIKYNIHVPLLIDARLGGDNIVIYTVNPCDPQSIKRYEDTLYSDEEASEAPCTRRSVIDIGFSCAALITRLVRRHFNGEEVESMIWFDQGSLKVFTS